MVPLYFRPLEKIMLENKFIQSSLQMAGKTSRAGQF
jgi:hypothetical protein